MGFFDKLITFFTGEPLLPLTELFPEKEDKIKTFEIKFDEGTSTHANDREIISLAKREFPNTLEKNIFVKYQYVGGFSWNRLTQVRDRAKWPDRTSPLTTVIITNDVYITPLYRIYR